MEIHDDKRFQPFNSWHHIGHAAQPYSTNTTLSLLSGAKIGVPTYCHLPITKTQILEAGCKKTSRRNATSYSLNRRFSHYRINIYLRLTGINFLLIFPISMIYFSQKMALFSPYFTPPLLGYFATTVLKPPPMPQLRLYRNFTADICHALTSQQYLSLYSPSFCCRFADFTVTWYIDFYILAILRIDYLFRIITTIYFDRW
jgi:hypothetical protein